jgi:predicted double-glycine peptidase
MRVETNAPDKIHGGAKADSRGYLTEVETTRIPNQQGDFSCGPACGVSELKKHGVDVSESELARLAGTMDIYGTDPTDLAMALNKKLPSNSGIEYRGGYMPEKYDPEKMFDARTQEGSWLIQINPGSGNHYVVVDKIDNGIVTVLDPWRLEKPSVGNGMEATISKQKLLEHWKKGDYAFIFPTQASK